MENETLIRLSIFLGLFALLACIEWLMPRRDLTQTRLARWSTNWGFTVANAVFLNIMAFALPLLAVGAAIDAGTNGWGLFNSVGWPAWLEVVIAILILDFAIWLQHLITHKVPLLWRLHQVHHADVDIDVTTAIRFHPVEIGLSMLLKIGLVRAEHDSNYGFALSIWDQMFGTYIPQPADGHDEMQIGLRWQDDRPSKFGWSMLLPFRNK